MAYDIAYASDEGRKIPAVFRKVDHEEEVYQGKQDGFYVHDDHVERDDDRTKVEVPVRYGKVTAEKDYLEDDLSPNM